MTDRQERAGNPAPKAARQERALALARKRYELGRVTRWPYARRGDRQYRFEDRSALRADLKAAWRAAFRDENPPSDTALNSVIADLRHLAMDTEPDQPTADERAVELLAEQGMRRELDSWDGEAAASAYEVRGGSLGWLRPDKDGGTVWTPLATFDAEITEEVIRDDGAERLLMWSLRVRTSDGRTGDAQITPDQLGRPQQWAAKAVGVSALVMPGLATADHLRAAVQSRSRDVSRRVVYTHTGWRMLGEQWAYLTSSGALGAGGLDDSVTVDLGPLSGYALPGLPGLAGLRKAIRASLALLDLAPDAVTVPVLATVYRSPLPVAPDCSVWVYGRSGTYKTALTALAQQHYGAAMNAQLLPGNWTSTGNSLEMQAYLLANALYVVDDYSPDSTKADAQRRAAAADRLLRGSANQSGRGRLRPDGTPRPVRPPRAQILTSAEDIPPGIESLRARLLVAEIKPGDISTTRLTRAQQAAADGTLATSMAGYVAWLARRRGADSCLSGELDSERTRLRDQARVGGHPRYALNIASLALGWNEWLAYATEKGAITAEKRDGYWTRIWKALCDVGAEQERFRRDADPVSVYLRSLGALVASGRAYVANPQGSSPADAAGWGWIWDDAGDGSFRTRGELIGWTDGDDFYLEPEAAYKAARQFAEAAGMPFTCSKTALQKALHERGLLASTQGPGRLTAKRTLAGHAGKNVLHLTVRSFRSGYEQ